MKLRARLSVSLVALLIGFEAEALEWFGNTLEGVACTGNGQGFGPYDFFDVDAPSDPAYREGRWWEVEVIHAQPGLAAMEREPFDQIAYDRAAAEFDYVLRAYPNHPQILHARIMLELKRRSARGIRAWQTPPECYLQRAAVFRPQQAHIPQLYGLYLDRLDRADDALEHYHHALELDPESAEAAYNLGLLYLKKGDHARALEYAHRAYARGFPLPGLRNRLRSLGVWTDERAER